MVIIELRDGDNNLFQFSVTIALQTSDIDVSLYLQRLEEFLRKRCERGMFSTERGGRLQHLHFQGVIEIKLGNGREVRGIINAVLGWGKPETRPTNAHLSVKVLSQNGLHTFSGLVGYCVKDEREDHFQLVSFNISEADFNTENGGLLPLLLQEQGIWIN